MKRFKVPSIVAMGVLLGGGIAVAQGPGRGSGGQQATQQQAQQQQQIQQQQAQQEQIRQQQAQQQQQQMQQQQQRQMQQQMQSGGGGEAWQLRFGETEQLRERFRAMEQRAGELEGTMARERERLTVQERDRDRAMQGLCESMGAAARQFRASVDGLDQAMRDPLMAGDPARIRDMDQLREQLRTMADGLDESLRLMEQLRTHQGQAG